MAEVGTPDKRFSFIAGWIGYLKKTSYQSLASFNPWIWAPATFKNTGIEERYAGFKGSVGDHFAYSTKVGFNKITNQPLFVNDTSPGKSFIVVNESQMKVLHYDGEVGYTVQEKFSMKAGFSFNHYMNLKDNVKAYGLLPLELNAAMKLQILKDLYLTSDLFAWGGEQYRKKNGKSGQLKGALDLNAGLEFKITKNLKLWSQFNNIFNKQYQRWNQYPVYGFNFVAGIIFAFDQKN
jgi:outer membrane receptor for ferrienterochelin and colicin